MSKNKIFEFLPGPKILTILFVSILLVFYIGWQGSDQDYEQQIDQLEIEIASLENDIKSARWAKSVCEKQKDASDRDREEWQKYIGCQWLDQSSKNSRASISASFILMDLERTYWKLLRSNKYNFEVEVPVSWIISTGEMTNEWSSITNAYIPGKQQKTGTEVFDGATFSIAVFPDIKQEIDVWVKKRYAHNSHNTYKGPVAKKIGLYDTLYVQWLTHFGSNHYYIKRGNTIFELNSMVAGQDKQLYQEDIDHMLASFRFIE